MTQNRKFSSVIVKVILTILAIGLFIGGMSSLRKMSPPYVQLSMQALATQQANTALEIQQINSRITDAEKKIGDVDKRLSMHTNEGSQRK